jgi:hypothetical protein
MDQQRVYCFDTSAFVTLSRTSTNIIEIPGSLWDHLAQMMFNGSIISHMIVYDEIFSNPKNPDFITKWIADKKDYFFEISQGQINIVPEIVKSFPNLIDYKMEREQADPWLIALAIEKTKELTLFGSSVVVVVTHENPNSSVKIPAACRYFGIEHKSLRGFFDEIGVTTQILLK